MTTDGTKKIISPMPEPWQMLNDLAYRLDWARARATKDNPVAANAEMRDALRAAMLDLLAVVKFYRTDREHPAEVNGELVPRFTVMALDEDGTTSAHGVFATEQEAMEIAARLTTETTGTTHTWVRRSLASVTLERANKAMERFLTETGLTENELANAVARHPA